MTMVLRSPVFPDFGWMPDRFAREGCAGASPPLVWWDVPPSARSFAIVCDDLDSPDGRRLRWVICDIPGEKREIAEAYPAIEGTAYTRQGRNDFGSVGYFGGCRRGSSGTLHFRFRLFAIGLPSLGYVSGEDGRRILGRAMAEAVEVAQLIGARPLAPAANTNALAHSASDRRQSPASREAQDRAAP